MVLRLVVQNGPHDGARSHATTQAAAMKGLHREHGDGCGVVIVSWAFWTSAGLAVLFLVVRFIKWAWEA